MSRVLITGANGFIGSNLCGWFRGRGWEVDALVRESSDLHFLDGLDVRLIKGDLRFPRRSTCRPGRRTSSTPRRSCPTSPGTRNARGTSST